MPLALLPASAAAYAPRAAPNIVLSSRAEPWLTQTLKRVNRIKRPLNSVQQHFRCLTETLSLQTAIWTLASIMLPKAPDADLRKDDNLLIEAISNYQMLHIEAYVVHIDMVSQNEIAFKLTQDTIDSLVEYHKDIYSVDLAANTWDWPEKEQQLKKLKDDFSQAVNRYVYRTHVKALEGLEDNGAGELLEGRSGEVKNQIMNLFLPLLPPPPKIQQEVVHHHAAVAYSLSPEQYWQQMSAESSPAAFHPADPWRVLGSTPSPMTSNADSASPGWSTGGYQSSQTSPITPISQPYTTDSMSFPESSQSYSTAGTYYGSNDSMTATSNLPMPSAIAMQCSAPGGFSWGSVHYPILT